MCKLLATTVVILNDFYESSYTPILKHRDYACNFSMLIIVEKSPCSLFKEQKGSPGLE